MNSDSYFEIGSSHMVCQDYALSGNYRDMWYGIVSDGCSSADYSEIGAQVLCHVTKNFLSLYYDLFFNETIKAEYIAGLLANSIRAKADEVRKVYPISRDSLQATLLVSVVVKIADIQKAFIFAWGDGVIMSSKSQTLHVETIDYPKTNAPVYLMTDQEAYKNKFAPEDCVKQTKMYTLDPSTYKMVYESIESINMAWASKTFWGPYVQSFNVNPGYFILLATDGLSQYQDQNKKPIEILNIIPSILDYPNYNGQFVKRTMNFLKRDLIRKNWSHADDIGIATIIV
jgi:serine/threonine protein phosphatase PrpC